MAWKFPGLTRIIFIQIMHLDARYHYILTREPILKTTLVDFLFKCAVEVPLRIDVQNVPRRDVCRTSSLIEENFFVRKDINKPTMKLNGKTDKYTDGLTRISSPENVLHYKE